MGKGRCCSGRSCPSAKAAICINRVQHVDHCHSVCKNMCHGCCFEAPARHTSDQEHKAAAAEMISGKCMELTFGSCKNDLWKAYGAYVWQLFTLFYVTIELH